MKKIIAALIFAINLTTQAADLCIASYHNGPYAMGDSFQVNCNDGSQFFAESYKIFGKTKYYDGLMKEMMEREYSLAASFTASYGKDHYLFKTNDLLLEKSKKYCIAFAYQMAGAYDFNSYRIKCEQDQESILFISPLNQKNQDKVIVYMKRLGYKLQNKFNKTTDQPNSHPKTKKTQDLLFIKDF